ncbi:hypothetical protein SANTM175S_02543 [Streptomyces antimycoticus]
MLLRVHGSSGSRLEVGSVSAFSYASASNSGQGNASLPFASFEADAEGFGSALSALSLASSTVFPTPSTVSLTPLPTLSTVSLTGSVSLSELWDFDGDGDGDELGSSLDEGLGEALGSADSSAFSSGVRMS